MKSIFYKLYILIVCFLFLGCIKQGDIYEVDIDVSFIPIIEALLNVNKNEIRILGGKLPNLFEGYSYQDYNKSLLDSNYIFHLRNSHSEDIQIPHVDDTLNFNSLLPYFYITPFNYRLKDKRILEEKILNLTIEHPELGQYTLTEHIPPFPDTIYLESLERELVTWKLFNRTDTASVFTLNFEEIPDTLYAEVFIFRALFQNQKFSGGTNLELKTNNPLISTRRGRENDELSYLFTANEYFHFNEPTKFYYSPDTLISHDFETNLHVRILSKSLYNYLKSIYNQPLVSIEEEIFIEPSDIYSQIPEGIGIFGVYKEFVYKLN